MPAAINSCNSSARATCTGSGTLANPTGSCPPVSTLTVSLYVAMDSSIRAPRWSCPWSGRWRTRTREAARPHAHAPARPRFPCSHLGACAAEGAPGRRRKPSARSRQTAGPSIFFFPTVWNRMFDGWSRSEGARQKTHQPSAVTVACSDSA